MSSSRWCFRSALLDSLTVFENVAFPLKERRHSLGQNIDQRVMASLDALGIADAASKYPADLSAVWQSA